MKKIITILLVLLLALFVFGCAKEEITEEKEEIVEEVVVEEEKGPMGSTESAKEGLLNLLSKKETSEYLVEYEVETETFEQTQTGGSVQQTMKATQIIAQKGKKMKVDSMQYVQGDLVHSMIFILEDGAYMCTEQKGKASCFGSSGEMQESETTSSDKIQENAENYPVVDAGTKEIAGETAKCYRILAGEAAYDDLVMFGCYSDKGVPLYIETTQQGSNVVMEATSYSTTVEDSEFELPAEPTGLSGLISPTG